MPTIFSHAVIGAAGGKILWREPQTAKFWWVTMGLSAVADVDVVGFAFGVRYADPIGHRGLAHSPFFAVLLALAAMEIFYRGKPERFSSAWWKLAGFFVLVAASHGVLDAMTTGGLGVAFLAPVDFSRFFLPWRFIPVSPIGLGAFLTPWGMRVLASEVVLLWIPAGLLTAAVLLARRLRRPRSA